MKLATLKYKGDSFGMKGNVYSFLFLENMQDVLFYQSINEQIKSRQSVNFWIGFKSQTFRPDIVNFAAHEAESDNAISRFMAAELAWRGTSTSLIDYCGIADNIINEIHAMMKKFILNGQLVRVQKNGGYCPIKSEDYAEYDSIVEINEQEMYNFLLNGDIQSEFKITSKTILIENDSYIPHRLVENFCDLTATDKNDIQLITSFKLKTILFKDSDYFNFFNSGIKDYGLTNIVLQTTAQDGRQISGIKKVMEALMSKHKDKVLNIYVQTYASDKHLFETSLPNINITFLK